MSVQNKIASVEAHMGAKDDSTHTDPIGSKAGRKSTKKAAGERMKEEEPIESVSSTSSSDGEHGKIRKPVMGNHHTFEAHSVGHGKGFEAGFIAGFAAGRESMKANARPENKTRMIEKDETIPLSGGGDGGNFDSNDNNNNSKKDAPRNKSDKARPDGKDGKDGKDATTLKAVDKLPVA